MPYLLQFDDSPPPAGYTEKIPYPPEQGVDWIIEGHRYRETERVATENGFTITLARPEFVELFDEWMEGVL